MDDELLALVRKAVEAGVAMGAQCEAFVQKVRHTSITVEGGSITFGSQDGDFGIGIRAIKDGRAGYAFCNEKSIDFGARQAIASSRFSKAGSYAFHDEKAIAGKSPFDSRIASMVPEDGIELARDMVDGASFDERALPSRGSVSFGVVEMAVANSMGVEAYDEGTVISGSMMSVIKDKGMVANGDEFELSRRLDFDFESIGHTATERAASQLGQKGIETASMDVIMRPSAAFDILCNTVAPALYGSAVKKNESVYAGRIGGQVANEGITLMDDGTLGNGLNTYSIDEEGYPSRRNVLIEDGILRMFLYDTFSAIESGASPTGSAMHAERLEAASSYKVPPTTCARNLTLSGDTASEDELIRETKKGILVLDVLGAHTSNRASGDFSVAIYAGYAIEDGEIAYPLKGGMIGGNMPGMLMKAELADNYKLVGSGLSPAAGYLPSLRFKDVRVSGD